MVLRALAVAAVFLLLLACMGATIGALQIYKTELESRAHAFSDRAFRRIYLEEDSEFLKAHATIRLMNEEGAERLDSFMQDFAFRSGASYNLQPARGRLRFHFVFPMALVAEGMMAAETDSRGGPILLYARIGKGGAEWEIDAISWGFVAGKSVPR